MRARASAKISAVVQGGFARVQFDWSEKVSGRAELAGGVLVISFDHGFDADTDAIAQQLEPYVALVRQDPDGRSLRLALKGPVRLKTTDHGSRFAFDILPPSFAGEPAPPPAPNSLSGKTAAQMAVRVTEREHTTRLQFDWPEPVDYTAKLENGKLRVAFSKSAKVDLKRFTSSPPAWVRGCALDHRGREACSLNSMSMRKPTFTMRAKTIGSRWNCASRRPTTPR